MEGVEAVKQGCFWVLKIDAIFGQVRILRASKNIMFVFGVEFHTNHIGKSVFNHRTR